LRERFGAGRCGPESFLLPDGMRALENNYSGVLMRDLP